MNSNTYDESAYLTKGSELATAINNGFVSVEEGKRVTDDIQEIITEEVRSLESQVASSSDLTKKEISDRLIAHVCERVEKKSSFTAV